MMQTIIAIYLLAVVVLALLLPFYRAHVEGWMALAWPLIVLWVVGIWSAKRLADAVEIAAPAVRAAGLVLVVVLEVVIHAGWYAGDALGRAWRAYCRAVRKYEEAVNCG